jgi:hypothetical protein
MDDVIGDLKNHTIPEEKDFVVSRIGGEIDVKAPKNRRREKEAAAADSELPVIADRYSESRSGDFGIVDRRTF